MYKTTGKLMLSLALAMPITSMTYAKGAKAPTATPPTSSNNAGNTLIDLGLNLAIAYAKYDPRYSVILTTLQINNAQDIRNLLQGNSNGTNFKNIIARLAFLQAQKDSRVRDVFAKLGITDEASLRTFLANNSSGSAFETILLVALEQAKSNPKYTVWLQRLNIRDVQDIKNLLSGTGKGGNLLPLILNIGLSYAQSNPKLAKYVPFIEVAITAFGVNLGQNGSGGSGSEDDVIDLGPYNGMTIGEVKAVRK